MAQLLKGLQEVRGRTLQRAHELTPGLPRAPFRTALGRRLPQEAVGGLFKGNRAVGQPLPSRVRCLHRETLRRAGGVPVGSDPSVAPRSCRRVAACSNAPLRLCRGNHTAQ